jgi:hypothetical protein
MIHGGARHALPPVNASRRRRSNAIDSTGSAVALLRPVARGGVDQRARKHRGPRRT